MNKLIERTIILLLLIFSFYYTNKIIDFLREKDPIMQEIKNKDNKYKVESINAEIIGNNIIPGKKGKEIDYNKSYNKMKKYGLYNEVLTVLKEVNPNISIDNNYDKYIIRGNSNNKQVALVFKVLKEDNINNIMSVLDKNNIPGNFFIDGTYLENNILTLKNMSNHELEILSYKNEYNESLFKTSISYLENITDNKVKYCYTEKDNSELLKLCSKNKLHTIKPTMIIKNNLYKQIKSNLDNSIIITIEINNYTEKELSTTIKYIKEKGYKIVKLQELLKE